MYSAPIGGDSFFYILHTAESANEGGSEKSDPFFFHENQLVLLVPPMPTTDSRKALPEETDSR